MACDSSPQTINTIQLPVELTICYQDTVLDISWKLDEVIAEYNDKLATFKLKNQKPCAYTIEFEARRLETNYFGRTNRYSPTASLITLNSFTPSIWRKHTTCHEIGHALMLDHSNRQTCMNPESEYEQLDGMDLRDIETRLAYLIG